MKAKVKNYKSRSERQLAEEEAETPTDVLEVWFAGCHSGKTLVYYCTCNLA